jgi:ABC-type siderophore export system fused ATPase/permease subunit
LPGLIWGLIWVWKKYHIKVNLWSAIKIFAASGAAAIVTLLFLMFFNLSPMTRTIAIVQLVVGFFLFLLVYFVAAPLAGAISIGDISNMRAMSSSLGIVSKVLELPLKIMEKALKLRGKARPNIQAEAQT